MDATKIQYFISHLPLYITVLNTKRHGVGANGSAKIQLREICFGYCHHLPRYHHHHLPVGLPPISLTASNSKTPGIYIFISITIIIKFFTF